MGTSHHEPMMRAQQEWTPLRQGPVELRAERLDPARVLARLGSSGMGSHENIVTIGMRGDGDMPMTEREQHRAARAHRRRPAADHRRRSRRSPRRQTPQVWALYKEVQDYYDKGMRVPDDVTLLFSDDNWGNIRRLPDARRSQPAGRLRHLLPLRLRRRPAQLQVDQHEPDRARLGADAPRVSSPARTGSGSSTSATSSRWSSRFSSSSTTRGTRTRIPAARLPAYTRRWAAQQFGAEHAPEIGELDHDDISSSPAGASPSCSTRRRTASPTIARPSASSPATTRCVARRWRLGTSCRRSAHDAYYELVLHPIRAAANLNELYVTVATNHLLRASRAAPRRTISPTACTRARSSAMRRSPATSTRSSPAASGRT